MKKLIDQVNKLENLVTEIKTDLVWIKRLLIGAASLGFLAKLIGLLVK